MAEASSPSPGAPFRAVGRRISRLEDPRLLRGQGLYTADVALAGTLHLAFVRSSLAHAVLSQVDATSALELPGVRQVLTAADIAEMGAGEMPLGWISPGQRQVSVPLLAVTRSVYVGQPVAVVVADDPYLAEDAAELVVVEAEPLPALTDVTQALEPDAPLIHPEWGTNVLGTHSNGNASGPLPESAIEVSGQFYFHRHSGVPMEGRAAIARPDTLTGVVTAWLSSQVPHHCRTVICEVCGWPEDRLHVVAPEVGGGFGVKEYPYAEDAIVCLLASRLGRPVRWVEDRKEHLTSANQAREQLWDAALASDASGRITGMRGRMLYDVGGHSSNQGIGVARLSADMLTGPYDIQDCATEVVGVLTNKTPSGAYRGFGVPQSTFVRERLIDKLAKRLDLDPVEVRRRNMIRPEQHPYRTFAGFLYDGGRYTAALDRAVEMIGVEGFRTEQAARAQSRRPLGLGFASFVQPSGFLPSRLAGILGMTYGGFETVQVRMDPSGKVTLLCGSSSQGQGIETSLAQACAEHLGVDPEKDVTVILGDTARTPYSPASAVASRIGSVVGATVLGASAQIADKLREIAAHMMEVGAGDIRLHDGVASVAGVPDREVSIGELAHAAYTGHDLPGGMLPGLDALQTFDPPNSTFPYATHAVTVEVDRDTGGIAILRYVVVQDCGTMLNPMIVEGQIIGAVAQGIGGAILEHFVYDDAGQPLCTSFADYLLPTAMEIPTIEIEHLETPAEHIPGGMKGLGEAGCTGPAAALANAVSDALGVDVDRLPLSPDAVWHLARGAQTGDL